MLLRADLVEADDDLLLVVETPGLGPSDVEVHVGATWVRVVADAREPARAGRVHRRERVRGRFARELPLPVPVLESLAEATLGDGVLTVRLPLRQRARRVPPPDATRRVGVVTRAKARDETARSPD